jgi:hypothetical protein
MGAAIIVRSNPKAATVKSAIAYPQWGRPSESARFMRSLGGPSGGGAVGKPGALLRTSQHLAVLHVNEPVALMVTLGGGAGPENMGHGRTGGMVVTLVDVSMEDGEPRPGYAP